MCVINLRYRRQSKKYRSHRLNPTFDISWPLDRDWTQNNRICYCRRLYFNL